jgi:hypothetical protein
MNVDAEKELMWKVLKTPPKQSLIQLLVESHEQMTASQELSIALHGIAVAVMKRPQFVHYEYRDEMVNEAYVNMMQSWTRASTTDLSKAWTYFATMAFCAAQNFNQREKTQRNIKDLAAEINLE